MLVLTIFNLMDKLYLAFWLRACHSFCHVIVLIISTILIWLSKFDWLCSRWQSEHYSNYFNQSNKLNNTNSLICYLINELLDEFIYSIIQFNYSTIQVVQFFHCTYIIILHYFVIYNRKVTYCMQMSMHCCRNIDKSS